MADQHIVYLLQGNLKGTLNNVERAELEAILRDDSRKESLLEAMALVIDIQEVSEKAQTYSIENLLDKVLEVDKPPRKQRPVRTIYWLAAASVLAIVSLVGYFLIRTAPEPPSGTNAGVSVPVDIAPGRSGAILTLGDGRRITVDSMAGGVIAEQGGSRVVLQQDRLVYDAYAPASQANWNTMTTPRGRQFSLLLPDGTLAWLNAESSIRFPTAFTDAERKVEITGEVYFEVKPDKKHPFVVMVDQRASLRVLGTSFNVNAYANEEAVHTTLIEGSLQVSEPVETLNRSNDNIILAPGEQAKVAPGLRTSRPLDNDEIEKVMAWKNGVFNFDGARLEEVMRQIARWYDITVKYEKGVPDIRFGGKMSRDISLAGLLRGLEASEVKFRIEEGRTLIVYP